MNTIGMKILLPIAMLLVLLTIPNVGRSSTKIKLKNGDLLFRQPRKSTLMGDAIKNVTQSKEDYRFTHVGIVVMHGGKPYVVEATVPKVQMVSLRTFLNPDGETLCDSLPLVVVARMRNPYRHLLKKAVKEAKKHIGKEYNYGFVYASGGFYCSELVYEAFLQANGKRPVFHLRPMTFNNPSTGTTDNGWLQYFGEKGLPIPEGELGINPGDMSKSEVLDLLGEIGFADYK